MQKSYKEYKQEQRLLKQIILDNYENKILEAYESSMLLPSHSKTGNLIFKNF